MCKFTPKTVDTPRTWNAILTMVEANEGLALIPQCVQFLHGNDIVLRRLGDGGCLLDTLVA